VVYLSFVKLYFIFSNKIRIAVPYQHVFWFVQYIRGDILGRNWDENLRLLLHSIHSNLLQQILLSPVVFLDLNFLKQLKVGGSWLYLHYNFVYL
jgi:hypothetical protein